jgi:hypothetical protein
VVVNKGLQLHEIFVLPLFLDVLWAKDAPSVPTPPLQRGTCLVARGTFCLRVSSSSGHHDNCLALPGPHVYCLPGALGGLLPKSWCGDAALPAGEPEASLAQAWLCHPPRGNA